MARNLMIIGFLMLVNLINAQEKDVLVTDLKSYFFGDWMQSDGRIYLSTQEDYLMYRNEIWFYQQIDDYHNYLDLKITREGEFKFIRIYFNNENEISIEEDMFVRSVQLKRLIPIAAQISDHLHGKWYNNQRTLEVGSEEILFEDKKYTVDHIITADKTVFVIGYNNSRYYLFDFERQYEVWQLNTYIDDVISFQPETWGQKYRIVLIVIISLFLVFVVILFIRWRMQRTHKKELARRQLVEMQLKTIRSQMNPHFIFNALGAIQNLILEKKTDLANSYLISFSQLLRLTLDKSEYGMVSLEEELDSIEKYLELEQLRFYFKYDIVIGKDLDPKLVVVPAMLIQPFVENAIIHGLNEITGDRKLTIRFERKGEILHIQVIDNGIGINATQKRKGIQLKREKYGIKLAEDRLQLINEGHKTNAHLKISDLSEEKNSKRGTRVQINMTLIS